MTIAIVQTLAKTKGTGTSLTSGSWGSNITVGSHILVMVWTSGFDVPSSITDTRGNTYAQNIATSDNDSLVTVSIWRARVATGGSATVTVNMPGSRNIVFGAVEVSGLTTSPDDQSASRNSLSSSSTTPSTSNFTTAQANELLVAVCVNTTAFSQVFTEPTSFTSQVQEDNSALNSVAGDGATRIVVATATYNPTWTLSFSDNWAAVAASYKAAPPALVEDDAVICSFVTNW